MQPSIFPTAEVCCGPKKLTWPYPLEFGKSKKDRARANTPVGAKSGPAQGGLELAAAATTRGVPGLGPHAPEVITAASSAYARRRDP